MPQLYSRRIRFFLTWAARLIVVAYVFQLAALDHRHADTSHVRGVEGTSQHVMHCHGAAAGCADGAGAVVAIAEVTLTPAAPQPALYDFVAASLAPSDVLLPVETQPPQA
jgi:hypothetical protein